MNKLALVTGIISSFFLCTTVLSGDIFAQENANFEPPQEETLEATIVEVVEEKEIEIMEQKQLYQKLKLLITKGSLKGKHIYVENGDLPMSNVQKYQQNDRVIVNLSQDIEGNDYFVITDYIRRQPLFILLLIFVVLVLLVGKLWGLASLISMAFTFFIIMKLILPQLLAGANPVIIAIIGSIFIIPVTFYLSHGVNKKTSVAIIGTFISSEV